MAVMLGEYQEIFLEEAEEQLDTLNSSLLELEKNYEDISFINEIFRAAHSLKSSAAFVGLTPLSELAHRMENLLQQVRDGHRSITDQIVEALFHCFDAIRKVVDLVSRGESPDVDMSGISNELQRIIDNMDEKVEEKSKKPEKSIPAPTVKSAPTEDVARKSMLTEIDKKIIADGLRDGMSCFDLNLVFEEGTPALFVRIQLVYQQLENIGRIVKTIPDASELDEKLKGRNVRIFILTDEDEKVVYNTTDVDQVESIQIRAIRLKNGNTSTEPQKSTPEAKQLQRREGEKATPQSEEKGQMTGAAQAINQSMEELTKGISQTVKVSVRKLDDLLNNVAELVIANSGFVKIYDEIRNKFGASNVTSEFKNRIEQMTRIAKDLQAGIMNTRMIPIGTVFKRFHRLVRDLSREHRKEINLVLRGEETELDKKVIDSIGEPLLHLIRNSVDHGIESPDERRAAGKDPVATIMLNSYQGGNRILVEVLDDGRGLNKEKIKAKALERNVINPTQLETMTDDDIYQLIFLPGFSTAEKITDISGRGVGMNVVKEVVSEMSGSVTVETEAGVGTKFTMTFPLTTAIIAAIMVRSSNELYAVPLSDVVETIKVSEEEISTIENHEVIYLREDVLSLVRMNRILDIQRTDQIDAKKKLPVVVVGYGNRKVGLVVDKLEGKQEIVIKSLEQNFRAIEGLSGASILGDGSIALILDVQAMINMAITNRVRLEEERFRNRMKQPAREKGGVSAEEYFKAFGKKEEPAKQEQIEKQETISTEKEPRAVEKTARIILSPGEVEMFDDWQTTEVVVDKRESADRGEEINANEKIELIRAEANANIRKAAEDGNVANLLLDQSELSLIEKQTNAEIGSNEFGLSIQQMDRLHSISNQGINKAADSLSQIVNKKVEMAIPELKVVPVEMIARQESSDDEPSVSIILKMEGELDGHVILSLSEKDAQMLVDLLYGLDSHDKLELNEDAVSALKEITNIVGSGLLNEIGNEINIKVVPSVPELIHDFFSSTTDSVIIEHAHEGANALFMTTEFFISDTAVMGKLFMMPKKKSMLQIRDKFRG